MLPTDYSTFIHQSRYARWNEELGRRETWEETVDRYFKFFGEHLIDGMGLEMTDFYSAAEPLQTSIINLEVMPSMRCLMTAGPALSRDHVAGYNCAYTPISDIRAFDEILFILMCATGVGFSVERQYVNQLPVVPERLDESTITITVRDSKRGWAEGYRELLGLLYAGRIPSWDVSRLRPAGARLKTMGGRSSGPEPLVELFEFTVRMFKNAEGRKLTSLECHDLVCKIGECIVAGGVRRSALLSLSNLSDQRMRDAKSGEWWVLEPQRALSNNSVAYTETPEVGQFMEEWLSLYQSKSGERGIFNREAARIQAMKSGRRKGDFSNGSGPTPIDFGTNPCSLHKDTFLMTSEGPRKISGLKDKQFVAYVNGKPYRARKGSWISGKKELFRLTTKEGYTLDLTADHRLMTESNGWVMAGNLTHGDRLVICKHDTLTWSGGGTKEEGYLLGLFVGDGNFSKGASENGSYFGQVKVWKDDNGFASLKKAAEESSVAVSENRRSDWKTWCDYDRNRYLIMNIGSLPLTFGLSPEDKHNIISLEETSSEFQRAFLQGMFDADGHVEGSKQAGYSIRLGQSHYGCLISVQRMLARFGIFSRIYIAKEEGHKLLPDGKGGEKLYRVKKSWRLVISGNGGKIFLDEIGFNHSEKKEKAKHIYGVKHKEEKFLATFESLTSLGIEEVWDAEVDEVVSFDANGFHAHNSEIILRPKQFCNLSTVVVRPEDNVTSLEAKVSKAAILGTWQSTLTNFRYLTKKWRDNCEEERLLGVSMTGIISNCYLNGQGNEHVGELLEHLKSVAVDTNREWAERLDVPQSTAVTCVKPEGTASQLVDAASGIHPAYSEYYIRRVRQDVKDPLTRMMIDQGVPHEQDVANPENIVFSFPMKAPEGSVLRNDMTAIEQLEHWKIFQDHWCEHKPSITVYVREKEWPAVGGWVFNNFDSMSGVSFLPHSDHIYKQAPYEEITQAQFEEMRDNMPEIDWSQLGDYETEDNTTRQHELACTAGQCDIL